MIHIKISNSQLTQIKAEWCTWFFRSSMVQKFIDILNDDTAFRHLIFPDDTLYIKWKNEYSKKNTIIKENDWQAPIIKYFFADLSDETNTTSKFGISFDKNTEHFFINNYDNYRQSKAFEKIINLMNIQVCPYCNRNFIESYTDINRNGKKFYFKGDLDHHYCKSDFPILALSFYNLIPCCKVCNHEKSDTTKPTFYPYYDYEEEYLFKIESHIENGTVWQGISDNFDIELKGKNNKNLSKHMQNSVKTFRLDKKYNHSKDYVKEILRKRYIYPEIKKKELLQNFGDIFSNEEELQKTFYSYTSNPENLSDRPLSKLTLDILNQLENLGKP